jgi:hypothetical protein
MNGKKEDMMRVRVPAEFKAAMRGPSMGPLHQDHMQQPEPSNPRDRESFFHCIPDPVRPKSTSRRAQTSFGENMWVVRLANHTMAALNGLMKGQFGPECLGPARSGSRRKFGRLGQQAREAALGILKKWQGRIPPADRLVGEAAVRRLMGPKSHRGSHHGSIECEAAGEGLKKGDMCEAQVYAISLPAPGRNPVPITSISPRCKAISDRWESDRLHPEKRQRVSNSSSSSSSSSCSSNSSSSSSSKGLRSKPPEEQKQQTLPEEGEAKQENYGRQWAGYG